MARFGFATGFDPTLNTAEMGEWVSLAEEMGYDSVFFSETLNLNRDSASALGHFATQTDQVGLVTTQVAGPRGVVLMAQTAATLDELSEGRVILAIGACTKSHQRVYGLPEVNPAQSLIEYIRVLRLLWTGEKVTYFGKTLQLNGVSLGWTPLRPDIPIWNAATSPLGLRLAGQYGDGVLLNSCSSPEYTRNAIAIVRRSVEETRRNWADFFVAQTVVCSVENSTEAALDAVRWEVANKFLPEQWDFNRSRLLVGEPVMKRADIEAFHRAYYDVGAETLARMVPDEVILDLTACGTPQQVQARVQEYVETGVELIFLRPATPNQTQRLLRLFSN